MRTCAFFRNSHICLEPVAGADTIAKGSYCAKHLQELQALQAMVLQVWCKRLTQKPEQKEEEE